MKRNGETIEYQVTLNIPDLRKKINKTCANRPVSCVNGEKTSDFGSDKEPDYRCIAALGRRACPLRHRCAMPPLPRGEALACREASPFRQRLSLWESWRRAPERARTLTKRNRRSDSIALPKRQLIAAWRLSGDGLALPVIAARCHLSQRERLFAPFCSKNCLKIHFIGLLFCYTPVRTKRHRREEE